MQSAQRVRAERTRIRYQISIVRFQIPYSEMVPEYGYHFYELKLERTTWKIIPQRDDNELNAREKVVSIKLLG